MKLIETERRCRLIALTKECQMTEKTITISSDHGSQEYDRREGPIAPGHMYERDVLDWFPKRLVEQNFRRVALERPLLAIIWTFHEFREEKRKDAGRFALEC